MKPINDGGLAFPVPMLTRQADGQPMSSVEFEMGGMSLRDWFAGRAMAAGLTNGRLPEMKLERDRILTMLGAFPTKLQTQ